MISTPSTNKDCTPGREATRKEDLERVTASKLLLEDCISAREDLGVVSARRLRAGSNEPKDDEDDEAVAMAAREFAIKMAELAAVAPGLSQALVRLTEAPFREERRKGAGGVNGVDGSEKHEEQQEEKELEEVPREGPKASDDTQELMRAVAPTLARLLSFDHLRCPDSTCARASRASSSIASALVRALANLWAGLPHATTTAGSNTKVAKDLPAGDASKSAAESNGPGEGEENRSDQAQQERLLRKTQSWVVDVLSQTLTTKVYGGKVVRLAELDALLAENGMDGLKHHRAVQVELVRSARALERLAGDAVAAKRRELSRKRPRPAQCGGGSSGGSSGQEKAVDGASLEDRAWDWDPRMADSLEEALAGPVGRQHQGMDPAESLFESTVKAFCCMAGRGEGEDHPPMEVLYSRLLLDSYRLLAAPERREWARAPLDSLSSPHGLLARPTDGGVFPGDDVSDAPQCSPWVDEPRESRRCSGAREDDQTISGECLPLIPPPPTLHRGFPPPLFVHPADWERRVRDCLMILKHRPLLCPEELLREARMARGWPSSFLRVASTGPRHAGRGDGGEETCAVDPPLPRMGRDKGADEVGLPEISEACLLVAFDMVEEAVLEGGGEAASGLLRALRTRSMLATDGNAARPAGGPGVGDGAGVEQETGAMAPLIALLKEAPSGCAEDTLGALVWAIKDMTLRYSNGSGNCVDGVRPSPPWRCFSTELWLTVAGYRPWLAVSTLHLLSAGRCSSCEWINGDGAEREKAKSVPGQADMGEVAEGRASHDESLGAGPGAAAWILAWFACGGVGTAESIGDMRAAVEAAATHLSCLSAADLGVVPDGSSWRDEKAPGNDSGPDRSGAGESASCEGTLQDLVQRIFGPSMAVAWLLVSPLSPEHGERLLRRIISEDDLDVALAAGGSPEDVSHASEAVLQGLASLEDMLWICRLRPPLVHAHGGYKLRRVLQRVETWLRRLGGRSADAEAAGPSVAARDFGSRRDMLCRQLENLLDELPSS